MSLVKNSSIVIIGVIVSNLLAYIFHFYVGRSLGAADYGVFGALMALYLILALPISAIGSAITKYTASFSSKNQYSKIGVLRKKLQSSLLIFGAVVFLFIILLSQPIADYLKIRSNLPVVLVGFTLIFAIILPVNRGVLQGLRNFKAYSWNSIIESASRLVLVVILLYFGLGVNGAVLAYGLAYFVAFLAIFPYLRAISGKSEERLEMKEIYKYIFLVLAANFAVQAIINLPTIFIKHYFTAEFTGFWNAALNLSRVSLFITGAISLVMFPEVASRDDKKEQRKIFDKALILTLGVGIGIALTFLLFGSLAVSLLYGSAYLGAVPILEYMAFAMIFVGVIQLCVGYWLARRG